MFKNPLSFDGRIRRTEYGLTLIIYVFATGLITFTSGAIGEQNGGSIIRLLIFPFLWFLWAQGAKRCHDLGNNGWWQIIPLYVFWLIFQDGQPGINHFGANSKGFKVSSPSQSSSSNTPNSSTTVGYQGGEYAGEYDGGHNNQKSGYTSQVNSEANDGYKNGELYK